MSDKITVLVYTNRRGDARVSVLMSRADAAEFAANLPEAIERIRTALVAKLATS